MNNKKQTMIIMGPKKFLFVILETKNLISFKTKLRA